MLAALKLVTWREIVFSLKCFAAAMLALYVAFRLDLSQPMWAVTTVYIVSQPLAGMVLSKSLYRVLGTLVGAAASLVLAVLFSESPELFCLALALWVGLSAAVTAYLRDAPQAYAGMLAGYSAAIIGIPAGLAPEGAFDIAVTRCLEIILGIGCATLMHHLVLPRRAGDSLRRALAATLPSIATWSGDALGHHENEPRALSDRRRVLGAIVQLDRLRGFAAFDSPTWRPYLPTLRQLEGRLLSLLAVLMSAYDRYALLLKHRPEAAAALHPVLEQAARHMAQSAGSATPQEAIAERAEEKSLHAAVAARLPAIPDLRADPAQFLVRSILRRLIDVLDLWQQAVWLYTHISTGARPPAGIEAPPARPYRDLTGALVAGGVTAIAVLFACAFWIFTTWPDGPTAITFTAVVCAIMGGQDDPRARAANFLRMSFVGTIIAGLYLFALLPPLSGFVPLVLAMAPFYLLCGVFMTIPATAARIVPLIFVGGGLMTIANRMDYDTVSFINAAIAYLIGIGTGGAALRLLRPTSVAWTVRRLLDGLFNDLASVCSSGRADRAAFENRMFDRINALFARLDPADAGERAMLQGGLASLRVGINATALRQFSAELPPDSAADVTSALAALAGHFARTARRKPAPIPFTALETSCSHLLRHDELPLATRAAEALFSITMTLRQHADFFGQPDAAPGPGIAAPAPA